MDAALGWLTMARVNVSDPESNQAEAAPRAPSHSGYGLVFRELVSNGGQGNEAYGLVQQKASDRVNIGRDWTGNVVRFQVPIIRLPYGQKPGYMDFIGSFGQRAAITIPVIGAYRYEGQLPMTEQPTLVKPRPWSDPSRGLP